MVYPQLIRSSWVGLSQGYSSLGNRSYPLWPQQGYSYNCKYYTKSQQHSLNLNPTMMKQEYKYAHPSTTSIPFRQLTYLQYCMFPKLFEQYIGHLLNEEDYQPMTDIFVLYAQTLFELVPFPIGADRNKSSLAFLEASPIGEQLLKRLQFVLANFPVEHIQMIFNSNLPHSLYNLICSRILDLFKETGQIMWSISEEDIEVFKAYMNSIPSYFMLLRFQQDVRKGRKLFNFQNVEQEINTSQAQYFQNLSHFSKKTIFYYDYSVRFRKMLEKLKFVFKASTPQPKQDMLPEIPQLNKMEGQQLDENVNLENVHLNNFYLRCLSTKQKTAYIKKVFDCSIKRGRIPGGKLKEIQLMNLLCLQELKNARVGTKLDLYLLLQAVKTQRKGNTQSVLEELKILFSFDKVPSIQYIFPLISSIINIRSPDQLSTQIIDFILKPYSKNHNNDHNYVRLALISSLYLHHKVTVIKSSSRRLQLEKLSQYQDIIQYFNNVEILDYFIELILSGKQTKLFERNVRLQNEGLGQVFGLRDAQFHLREYLVKTNISQDGDDQVEISNNKILSLLEALLQKRQRLTSLADPNSYFHSRLLSLISSTQLCSKFSIGTTQSCLLILREYSIMSPYHEINQKTIKMIFFILIISLERYPKEALLCYLLSMSSEAINWEKVDHFVRCNLKDFAKMNAELFSCIPAFDFVEILVENTRAYQALMNQWISQDQNFVSYWPDSRKQKGLISKRSKLIGYLLQKFGKDSN